MLFQATLLSREKIGTADVDAFFISIFISAVLVILAYVIGWIRKKEGQSQSRAEAVSSIDPVTKRINQYNKHSTEILLIHRYRLREKADDLRSKKIRHFTADPELTAKLGLYDKLDAKEQVIRNEITILDETLQLRGLEAGKHYYK